MPLWASIASGAAEALFGRRPPQSVCPRPHTGFRSDAAQDPQKSLWQVIGLIATTGARRVLLALTFQSPRRPVDRKAANSMGGTDQLRWFRRNP